MFLCDAPVENHSFRQGIQPPCSTENGTSTSDISSADLWPFNLGLNVVQPFELWVYNPTQKYFKDLKLWMLLQQ